MVEIGPCLGTPMHFNGFWKSKRLDKHQQIYQRQNSTRFCPPKRHCRGSASVFQPQAISDSAPSWRSMQPTPGTQLANLRRCIHMSDMNSRHVDCHN